ncbi:NAD(P)H-dependent FMN reductase [Streptosporangium becharense]|uniref:NAD(P)H-dependent FMN reductase n=1 Tax=Streptosporangium becharense TaxID=1816182 RepID=A0A7W9ICH9_9ACTN|nr:NAD(P)H-dependent oxidoreductase [Streptosporangium becharense]MBB2915441.1 NAD(P)H-dependent FMN reductase [Streptosporangium becharense]MBB5817628.1 NAD(P)H-dependent FMN reductase [Streptosporangium becharense]
MSKPVLQIVVASTRPGRVGLPVGEWMLDEAVEHKGFEPELVDLAEVGLPLLDEPNHPRLRRYEHRHTKDWSARVDRADAFVFVIPEYNHGFNAAIKNALDYLYQEWQHKPVGFVSYGGVAGGTRALQMLKPVVAALKMVPLVEAVNIPFVRNFLDDEQRLRPSEAMTEAAAVMLDELARMSAALRPLRESGAEG